MKLSNILLLTFFCLASSTMLISQESDLPEVLITDRPDATESPSVVPKGYLQIETGAFYEENGDRIKEKTTAFNTTLLRYGLLERIELRVGWDFSEVKTEIDGIELSDIASGLSPLLLGAKVNITEEEGWMPEIGLLGHLQLPFTAGNDFRPETTAVDFRFSFAHTLSDRSNLGYNLGAAWGNDSPEASYEYTLSYGYSVTKIFGIYAELYGDFPEDNRANHLWDAGITYLLNNFFQLDATVGSGITEGQNILISAGFSLRLPK